MMTMSYKVAAAGASAVVTSMAAASPAPLRPVRRTARGASVPVKPMGTAGTPHSSHPRPVAVVPSAKQARRDRVVLEHLPLVKAIAVRVHENLPVHVDWTI